MYLASAGYGKKKMQFGLITERKMLHLLEK